LAFMAVILSYLIGSISFGYLFARLFSSVDIRSLGSGSTGATNISRLLGLKMGLVVLVLDVLKGFIAVFLGNLVLPGTAFPLLCGLVAIIGHNWPVFFGFKGGRGVATTLGVFLGFSPLPALIVLLLFCVIVAITRYVSLGSLTGSICIPVYMQITAYPPEYFLLGLAICLLIIIRHAPNIKKLINGTESKFGEKIDSTLTKR